MFSLHPLSTSTSLTVAPPPAYQSMPKAGLSAVCPTDHSRRSIKPFSYPGQAFFIAASMHQAEELSFSAAEYENPGAIPFILRQNYLPPHFELKLIIGQIR